MKQQKSACAIVLMIAILVAWVFLWRPASGHDMGSNLDDGGDSGSPPPATKHVATEQQGEVSRQAVTSPSIAVVARDTKQPLTTASLTVLSPSGGATLRDPPVADADASGILASDVLTQQGTTALVRAPGYVPYALEAGFSGQCEVALDPAAVTTVTVLDSAGRLVPDAWVTLSTEIGAISLMSQASPPAPGIGHPLSNRPMWIAATGPNGVAEFSELPPRRLYLNVLHPALIPLQETGVNSPVEVVAGRNAFTVSMQVPFAVVFRCPSRSPITDVTWNIDVNRLDRSPQVMSRLAMIHQAMQEKFPDCLVYCHKPADPDLGEVPVRCRVTCSDDTFWVGTWPLQPIDAIATPVFLEQDLALARRVTITLRDSEDHEFGDVPYALIGINGELRVDGMTGSPLMVPYGEYELQPKLISAAIWSAFVDQKLTVNEQGPDEHVLKTNAPLAVVIVTPKLPGPEFLAPLEIYFYNEDGQGPASIWTPSRGPVRNLLAAKRISLRIRSMAYEDLDIPAQDIEPGVPLEIEFAVREKVREEKSK